MLYTLSKTATDTHAIPIASIAGVEEDGSSQATCPKRCNTYPNVAMAQRQDSAEEVNGASSEGATPRHVAIVYPYNHLPVTIPLSIR